MDICVEPAEIMEEVLRQRLMRKIESLPEEQVYQVLDYIEFLDTKYGGTPEEASGLQKFAEGIQDKMRKKAMNPSTLREAFQIISTADKVLSSVSNAGKQLMEELTRSGAGTDEDGESVSDEPLEGTPDGDSGATSDPGSAAGEEEGRQG
jgi:Protein of unknown function (DUF2281)